MNDFRLLRADEIDVRIATVSSYGVSLLLYKDARCDQNILDESVGPLNWQRHHSRDNANCTVSIWDADKNQWIEKEDTGTESYTEKEKGLASDSFKRACFNWGIGRELYTAPSMFVRARDLKTLEEKNGKWTCKDYFTVVDIKYEGRKIQSVQILNTKTGALINFGDEKTVTADRETDKVIDHQFLKEHGRERITPKEIQELEAVCKSGKISRENILASCNKSRLCEITYFQYYTIMNKLNAA